MTDRNDFISRERFMAELYRYKKGSVTRRQAHQAELPRQVLAQRRRRRLHVLEIVVVVVERAR